MGHAVRSAVLAALVVSLTSQSAVAFTWAPCEGVDSKGKVEHVSLTPDPPYPGSTAKFVVNGTAGVEVDSGTLNIAVSYLGLPIYSESKDLCEKTACPVKKGPVTVELEEPFPIITPPGPYTVRITVSSAEAVQLLCLDVNFYVVPPGHSLKEGLEQMGHGLGQALRGHSQ